MNVPLHRQGTFVVCMKVTLFVLSGEKLQVGTGEVWACAHPSRLPESSRYSKNTKSSLSWVKCYPPPGRAGAWVLTRSWRSHYAQSVLAVCACTGGRACSEHCAGGTACLPHGSYIVVFIENHKPAEHQTDPFNQRYNTQML